MNTKYSKLSYFKHCTNNSIKPNTKLNYSQRQDKQTRNNLQTKAGFILPQRNI